MMNFRSVSESEFDSIYDKFMMKDFPSNELKDLAIIHKAFQKGKYDCIVMKEDGEIRAYACFSWSKESIKILDYLAVVGSIRGKGYGSQLLTWLKENDEIEEIVIESEDPEFAKNEAEKIIRNRRVSFYEKNGMSKRNICVKLAEVEFNILTFNTSLLSDKELLKEMLAIYHEISPELHVIPY